jgi:hypothetical protein
VWLGRERVLPRSSFVNISALISLQKTSLLTQRVYVPCPFRSSPKQPIALTSSLKPGNSPSPPPSLFPSNPNLTSLLVTPTPRRSLPPPRLLRRTKRRKKTKKKPFTVPSPLSSKVQNDPANPPSPAPSSTASSHPTPTSPISNATSANPSLALRAQSLSSSSRNPCWALRFAIRRSR